MDGSVRDGRRQGRPGRQRARLLAVVAAATLAVAAQLTMDVSAREPIADREITQGVDRALHSDSRLPFAEIGVLTLAGIVTLVGHVQTLRARELAVEHALAVLGVRGVVDRLEIHPEFRDEHALRIDVERAIRSDLESLSSAVHVTVRAGRVMLTGLAETRAATGRLTDVVKGIPGVRAIDNMVVVRDHVASGAPDDAPWPAAEVRSDATRRAREIRSDHEILDAVQDALLADPRVRSYAPNIWVKDGVVTLQGWVRRLRAKQAAEQDACHIVGVARVQNELLVSDEP